MERNGGRNAATVAKIGVLIFALFACWHFVLPTSLGGSTTYTIVSGPSMEPRFHTGDLVIARPARRYPIGQVVIYKIPDPQYSRYRVVHRIVDRLPDGRYVVQGDNQDHADPWMIPHDNIAGGEVLAIAKGGYLLGYLRNPLYLGVALACLVTYLFWPSKAEENADERVGCDGDAGTDEGTVASAAVRAERPVGMEPLIVLTESGPTVTTVPSSPRPVRRESDVDVFIREWIDICAPAGPAVGPAAAADTRATGDRETVSV
jgi:signal peptidase I